MKRTSEAFYLLQRIQDEVHRFAITFHRQQRGKIQLHPHLMELKELARIRKKMLLKHFGSLKKMQDADKDAVYRMRDYVRS